MSAPQNAGGGGGRPRGMGSAARGAALVGIAVVLGIILLQVIDDGPSGGTGSVPTDVLVTAFKGSDGTVVVVAINKGAAAATVPIAIAGGTAPASMTPWVTSSSDNLAAKTAVAVSGGSFTASLASKTVTTFVGKP